MTLLVLSDASTFRQACETARAEHGRIAFVPTMGALHEGHRTLIRQAQARAPWVAVSLFVNPTQFGPQEDFANYPRNPESDLEQLRVLGVQAAFAPPVEELYPANDATRVHVTGLSGALCSPHRPDHFVGVATIVTKLFALSGPCLAFFGNKDYQQLQIIRRLVADLLLPVTVVGVATVREPDGLAMSSRNAYLTPDERPRALALITGLRSAYDLFAAGEQRAVVILAAARAPVNAAADAVDYVSLVHPDTLALLGEDRPVGARALLAIAARIGKTRLIDNVVLGEDERP